MKKKFLISATLTGSLSAAATTYALVGNYTKKLLYRSTLNQPKTDEFIKKYKVETIKIKNHNNLILNGYFIDGTNSDLTLMMLHPLLEDSTSLIKYIDYLKGSLNDCSVLLIDACAHGLSDGYIRGFGYRDVFDLMYWNQFMLQKFGEDHRFVMYGKEMGANTILNTSGLGKLKNVDAIISDSAYKDVVSYISAKCFKEFKAAEFIATSIIRRTIKNELNIDTRKMDTSKYIKNNTIPTIFIHSKDDEDVPFKQIFALYNNTQSEKVLFPIKEKSFVDMDMEDSYSQTLNEFLKQNVLKK